MGGLEAKGITSDIGLNEGFSKSMVPDLATPTKMLGLMERSLSGMGAPISAGKVLQILKGAGSGNSSIIPPEIVDDLRKGIMPHLLDDAQLDKGEIIEVIAGAAEKYDDTKPDQNIIDEAASMLKRLGVEDEGGSLAQGMAKASILGAIGIQSIESGVRMAPESGVSPGP